MAELFAVQSFWQLLEQTGYIIEFTTDRPCHLWLRYTSIPPVRHMESTLRRGLLMHLNPRWCFVAYQELEQHEAGDTLLHSFNLVDIAHYPHVWFYLYGYINGILSPSTGPIMDLPMDQALLLLYDMQVGSANQFVNVTYNKPEAMTFQNISAKVLTGIHIWIQGPTANRRVSVGIYNTSWTYKPTGDPLTSCVLDHIPYKRQFPSRWWLYFPMPPIWLDQDKHYSIVAYGDPTDPDAVSFKWSIHFDIRFWPQHLAFYGTPSNGGWNWTKHNLYVLEYGLYRLGMYYRPGSVHPRKN